MTPHLFERKRLNTHNIHAGRSITSLSSLRIIGHNLKIFLGAFRPRQTAIPLAHICVFYHHSNRELSAFGIPVVLYFRVVRILLFKLVNKLHCGLHLLFGLVKTLQHNVTSGHDIMCECIGSL